MGQLLQLALYSTLFLLEERQAGPGELCGMALYSILSLLQGRQTGPGERWGGGNSYMGSSTPSIMFPLDETQTETWKGMGAVTNSYMVLYSILFLMEEGQTGLRER